MGLLGARRALLCVAAALLLPAGAALGAARIAAIDRSDLAPLAGRDVTLRGYVTKRERTSFGVRRFRVRVTRSPARARARPRAAARVTRRALPAAVDRRRDGGDRHARTRRGAARATSTTRPTSTGPACTRSFARASPRRPAGGARASPGAVDALRRRAEAGVSAGLAPPLAALARGMVLGEDEDISERTSEDFKRSGLAHVLAVSGQNVTLLAVLAGRCSPPRPGRQGRLTGCSS